MPLSKARSTVGGFILMTFGSLVIEWLTREGIVQIDNDLSIGLLSFGGSEYLTISITPGVLFFAGGLTFLTAIFVMNIYYIKK